MIQDQSAPPPDTVPDTVRATDTATAEEKVTFLNRTLSRLRRALDNAVNGTGGMLSKAKTDPALGKKAIDAVRAEIEDCITAPGGEVAARAQAAELGRYYLDLNEDGKARFLSLIADEFGTDEDAVNSAAKAVSIAETRPARLNAEARLRKALTPRRMALLTQFNALPDGVKFLVDLRADLLRIAGDTPNLRALDDDLKWLLSSWFDLGFLDLERITWDSPAALLEKLIAYEAVHRIESWSDLRNRLDSDRRCYALFHPRMPSEPLAFVEVALVKGMSDNVQVLLDETAPLADPQEADAAIFYSISNTQRGLKGISFGEYLIKRVVAELSRDFPRIKTFATLSPVPGFRVWLDATLAKTPEVAKALPGMDKIRAHGGDKASGKDNTKSPAESLITLVSRPDWQDDADACALLEPALTTLLGLYFADRRSDGKPIDPVARFHLRNGARLERFNWLGDISAKGMRQAYGFMVNYRYKLDAIDANHIAYQRDDEIVASRAVKDLIRKDRNGHRREGRRLRLRPARDQDQN
jgi:malonyl-CoA decarboxylase